MAKKTVTLSLHAEELLEMLGYRIRQARLRRNLSVEEMAQQTAIGKSTLTLIEKGMPTVSIGAYVAVLEVLELEWDIEQVALDENGKRKFRELNIKRRERASRRHT